MTECKTECKIETMPRAAAVAIALYVVGYRLPPAWQHHEFECVGDTLTGDPCQCGWDGKPFDAEVGYLNRAGHYVASCMKNPEYPARGTEYLPKLWLYADCPMASNGRLNVVCLHHAQVGLGVARMQGISEKPCIPLFDVLQYLAAYEELMRHLGLSDEKDDDLDCDCDNCEADTEGRCCDDCMEDDEPTDEINEIKMTERDEQFIAELGEKLYGDRCGDVDEDSSDKASERFCLCVGGEKCRVCKDDK